MFPPEWLQIAGVLMAAHFIFGVGCIRCWIWSKILHPSLSHSISSSELDVCSHAVGQESRVVVLKRRKKRRRAEAQVILCLLYSIINYQLYVCIYIYRYLMIIIFIYSILCWLSCVKGTWKHKRFQFRISVRLCGIIIWVHMGAGVGDVSIFIDLLELSGMQKDAELSGRILGVSYQSFSPFQQMLRDVFWCFLDVFGIADDCF